MKSFQSSLPQVNLSLWGFVLLVIGNPSQQTAGRLPCFFIAELLHANEVDVLAEISLVNLNYEKLF